MSMFAARYRIICVLGAACALILAASVWLVAEDFKGSKLCKMCHANLHKPIVDGFAKVAHPKAFADVTKNPEAIVAAFDANSPITKEQIKYTLGSGRTAQAYLDANLRTLPARWSVKDKKWVAATEQDAKTQCLGCHVTGYNAAAATWTENGVTCEACHGPGSAHTAGDKTKIINPRKLTSGKGMMVCGQCHSKGTDPSKTYAFPMGYKVGDDLAQSFVDAQPTTAGADQQYSDLKRSKHFTKDVTCVTCHDPHGAGTTLPNQLRKPINELCLGCHPGKDMKTHAPSASADATCAKCHMPNGRHTFIKPKP